MARRVKQMRSGGFREPSLLFIAVIVLVGAGIAFRFDGVVVAAILALLGMVVVIVDLFFDIP